MEKIVYSMTVLNPIRFPDEIEIQIHPLDPKTDQRTGGEIFICEERRSWEWIRSSYPISTPSYFDEVEGYLKQGLRANLVRGDHPVTVADGEESMHTIETGDKVTFEGEEGIWDVIMAGDDQPSVRLVKDGNMGDSPMVERSKLTLVIKGKRVR